MSAPVSSTIFVLSKSLPIKKLCAGIDTFSQKFDSVEGINVPKRIKCRGTDGIWRPQLVKGKDDLRQDAVMQQVFTIMNGLLTGNKQTNKLLIRTYKVSYKKK